MKTTLLLLAALCLPAAAVEYFTLTPNTTSRAVDPTDVVEIVGTTKNADGYIQDLTLTYNDGSTIVMAMKGKEGGAQFDDMKGNVFTGLTQVALSQNNTPISVTFKITPANEVGSTPGTTLVIPENATGDYDVVIESSDDLVNWSTVVTHVVDGATSPNFFRARIIKTVAP
ncbi:hypothetical protein HAHE_27300 [Haloferula helveola]|uniref:Uncharacterized protein n=1 Tax=Haloferula helveola TaxID=490095 RepID=A0ABN6H584_9BACT|nr:hypothetical protein HAHE_27300 [Haloferula helveola]